MCKLTGYVTELIMVALVCGLDDFLRTHGYERKIKHCRSWGMNSIKLIGLFSTGTKAILAFNRPPMHEDCWSISS